MAYRDADLAAGTGLAGIADVAPESALIAGRPHPGRRPGVPDRHEPTHIGKIFHCQRETRGTYRNVGGIAASICRSGMDVRETIRDPQATIGDRNQRVVASAQFAITRSVRGEAIAPTPSSP